MLSPALLFEERLSGISGEKTQANMRWNRAIMSVVKENPDLAYVKGGPFSKLGVDLPEVAAHVWWSKLSLSPED